MTTRTSSGVFWRAVLIAAVAMAVLGFALGFFFHPML